MVRALGSYFRCPTASGWDTEWSPVRTRQGPLLCDERTRGAGSAVFRFEPCHERAKRVKWLRFEPGRAHPQTERFAAEVNRAPKWPLLAASGLVKLGLDRLDGGPNVFKPGGSGVFTPLFSIETDGVLAEEIRTNRQFRRRTNAIRAGDPVLHDTASIVGPGPLPRRGWQSLAQPLGVDRQRCLRHNHGTLLSDKKASSWEITPGFVCPQTTSQARERRRRRSRRATKRTPRFHRAPQQKAPQNGDSRRLRHRRDETAGQSEPLDK